MDSIAQPHARDQAEQTAPGNGATAVQPALVTAPSDHCPNCGAHLAPDQRYCVECGERRGEARFSPVATTAHAAPAPAPPPEQHRRVHMSANATLIAGVGTLLLAMGTGVLIGRSGDHGTKTAAPQIVTVSGGGTASSGTTGASAATSNQTASSSSKSKSKRSSSASSNSHASVSNSAASKVLKPTKSAGKLPPSDVKLGQKGSGRGYKNGKFTGDFFGDGQ